MSDDNDSSDDDLFENAGLSSKPPPTSRRRQDLKRKKTIAALTDALHDDDVARKSRIAAASSNDDDAVMEQAQQALEDKRQRVAAEAIKQVEKDVNTIAKERRVTAQETSGSDLLGTRRNVLLAVPRDPLVAIDKVKLLPTNMKLYLKKHKGDMVPVLDKKELVKKFGYSLPPTLIDWLWRQSIDLESDCRVGAFKTLQEYYQHHNNNDTNHQPKSLTVMLQQLQDWFLPVDDESDVPPPRDDDDDLQDVQHWLDLWSLRLQQQPRDDDEKTVVADLVVFLSHMVLDVKFHVKRANGIDASWHKIMRLLLERLEDDEDLMTRTVTRILEEHPIPAAKGNDDKQCWLSRSLMARTLLSVSTTALLFPRQYMLNVSNNTPLLRFPRHLALATLAQLVGVTDDWNTTVLQKHPNGWDGDDVWCIVAVAFQIVEEKGDEIRMNGPRILATLQVVEALLEATIIVEEASAAEASKQAMNKEQDDKAKKKNDPTTTVETLNSSTTSLQASMTALMQILRRMSSHHHFTKSEIILTHIMTLCKALKDKDNNSNRSPPKKQKTLKHHFESKNNNKVTP